MASKKPRHGPWCFALVFIWACHGDGYRSPTAPEVPAADLSGAWSGTVTVTYDVIDGGGDCAETAAATLVQSGRNVSGTLTDSPDCGQANAYRFTGTSEGSLLEGTFVFPDFTWPASGRLTANQLQIGSMNVQWDLRR